MTISEACAEQRISVAEFLLWCTLPDNRNKLRMAEELAEMVREQRSA